jgi:electron transfer flavoprotein beta subunit
MQSHKAGCWKMKILVCVKEVPDLDPDIELEIDEETNWIKENEMSRYMMNRFDEVAVEEALLIRERFHDTSIDALTIGPERSQAVIRRAMGMGVDHGIHIITPETGYLNPHTVSSLIACVAEKKGYDLILSGVMAEDTQQGQTGIMIAEHLKIPWASSVIKETISEDSRFMSVEREIEGGMRDVLKIPLPCLLTLQTGINQPRYPALSKVMKAHKAELEIYSASDFPVEKKTGQIIHIGTPRKERNGEVLTGSPHEKADKLLKLLLDKSFIQ